MKTHKGLQVTHVARSRDHALTLDMWPGDKVMTPEGDGIMMATGSIHWASVDAYADEVPTVRLQAAAACQAC